MTRRAEDVFAPTDAYGAPRAVNQAEAQDWGMGVDRVVEAFKATGGLYFATRADADASTDYTESRIAWVAEDPTPANNGVIAFAPSTKLWRRIGPLPYGLVTATVTGGTENAIEATTPILASEAPLIILPIATANTTSPVTVTFNEGAALTIKTASGADVPVGGLLTSVLGRVVGATFCLLMSTNDEAISITTASARAAVQAAETATTKADEAASHAESAQASATSAAASADKAAAAAGGGVMTFNTRAPTNGNISPEAGDYTAEQVGAVPTSRKIKVGSGLSLDGTAGSNAAPAEVDLSADRLLKLLFATPAEAVAGVLEGLPVDPVGLAAALAAIGGGGLKNVRVITASGNVTPSDGVTKWLGIVQGAGGAGGGRSAVGVSGGGAAGGATIFLAGVDDATSYPSVIGSGGAAVSNGNGNAGGDSTLTIGGVTYKGSGGAGNASGTAGTGTNGLLNLTGGLPRWYYYAASSDLSHGGRGGDSPLGLGQGGREGGGGTGAYGGTAGTGYGSGGGGACVVTANGTYGGAGAPGVIIILEF